VFPEQIVDYSRSWRQLGQHSRDHRRRPEDRRQMAHQYATLDALIAHAADIPGKVGENLRGELPALELSRKLATSTRR